MRGGKSCSFLSFFDDRFSSPTKILVPFEKRQREKIKVRRKHGPEAASRKEEEKRTPLTIFTSLFAIISLMLYISSFSPLKVKAKRMQVRPLSREENHGHDSLGHEVTAAMTTTSFQELHSLICWKSTLIGSHFCRM